MITFILWQLLRVLVFGVALTFACKRVARIKVEPPSALPLVAIVYALLNAALYWLLAPLISLLTFWLFWFLLPLVVPFLANVVLLLMTDRLVKALRIETLGALARTAGILTLAHLGLRLLERLLR